MDHFLSGLEGQSSTGWYNHRAFQHHDFPVGANSLQLIPISAPGIPTTVGCSSSDKVTTSSTSSSTMISSSASIAAAAAAVAVVTASPSLIGMAQVKQEMDSEDRYDQLDAIPLNSVKGHGTKHKGGKWDTKKICNICGKILSRGDKLKNHIRIHTNNFPYHCDTCGQGFLRAEGLRVHTRVHTGERPYVCIICGKSYTRKDKLTRHAIVHTGERPFVCQHCGKSFTRKDKMQRHELIHKVEKPWTCVPCNVEFVRQEGFNAHMEKKHPERLPYTVVQHPRLLTTRSLSPSYEVPERPPTLVPTSTSLIIPSTSSGAHDHSKSNSPVMNEAGPVSLIHFNSKDHTTLPNRSLPTSLQNHQ